MQKLHIIQATAYYPPHLGGMENCAREISEKLSQKGNIVEVFTSNIDCKNSIFKSVKNLKVNYLESYEVAHTPIIPSLFIALMKIPKNSIIHLHVAQAFVPEIVWLVSKIRKIPYIAHMHLDVGPSGKLGFMLPIYKKFLLGNILHSASRVIVPTKDYVSLIIRKYKISNKKIVIIPSGVDLDNFKPSKEKHVNSYKLLFVGRLSIQKNIPLLIKSFKRVVNNGIDNISLSIVGNGEEKDEIIDLIKRKKLEGKIIMHGALRGRKLYQMYKDSDIFILTSRAESFGIVLLEAMASGLPIIASNIPGIRNVIENGKTGLLVVPTEENFTKAIELLTSDNELRVKLIKNGLKESKKYDWNTISTTLEGIYKEVLNENN
jgi:glycosyltransferase involved in cell wall biosynthesis